MTLHYFYVLMFCLTYLFFITIWPT